MGLRVLIALWCAGVCVARECSPTKVGQTDMQGSEEGASICPELNEEQRCSMANVTHVSYSAEGRYGRREITNTIDQFVHYVPDTLIQEPNTEFAYFDPVERTCKKYEPKTDIMQGCAPFASEAACTFACKEWDKHKAEEALEELEGEAV